jgi:hypothetical protein
MAIEQKQSVLFLQCFILPKFIYTFKVYFIFIFH